MSVLPDLAIACTAIWALAFTAFAAGILPRGRRPADALAMPPSMAPATPDGISADIPPALVSLAAGKARLNAAAYGATILDLAGRGYLTGLTPQPGQLWCSAVPDATGGADLAALTDFERMVLSQTAQLAAGHGAPFQVLADRYAADLAGAWTPFADAVSSAGRTAGLTRDRVPRPARAWLLAALVPVVVLCCLAIRPDRTALPVAATASVLLLVLVHKAMTRPVLTRSGARLAAYARGLAAGWRPDPGPAGWLPAPAELRQLARLRAAGAPLPRAMSYLAPIGNGGYVASPPSRQAKAVSGSGAAAARPAAAWSSLSGQWLNVPISAQPDRGHRAARNGLAGLLSYGYYLMMIAMASLISLLIPFAGRIFVLAGLGGLAAIVAGRAVLYVRAWQGRWEQMPLQGQVIARWVEQRRDEDSSWLEPHIAIDDGLRSWNFAVDDGTFRSAEPGTLVRAQMMTLSRKLASLEPVVSDFARPAPSRQA
jgi:hypothetical protein